MVNVDGVQDVPRLFLQRMEYSRLFCDTVFVFRCELLLVCLQMFDFVLGFL